MYYILIPDKNSVVISDRSHSNIPMFEEYGHAQTIRQCRKFLMLLLPLHVGLV